METVDKIKEIINNLRPFLINDGGNIEFIKYEKNIVYIKMSGACAHCHMLDLTLKNEIEATIIENIPEVRKVINLD
ncbi:MAG: NifU family protein [Bacilli bacterium]